MPNEESDQPLATTSRVARVADTIPARMLRAAIPLIPVVGGTVSVLVEAHLAAQQIARIDLLFARIYEIQKNRPAGTTQSLNEANPFSDRLLGRAARAAIDVEDAARPPVFANILYHNPKDDPSELLRAHLLDIATTLTPYELATLLSLNREMSQTKPTSDFRRALMEMQLDTPNLSDLQDYALGRLNSFRLIDQSDSDAELTAMGRKLLSVF